MARKQQTKDIVDLWNQTQPDLINKHMRNNWTDNKIAQRIINGIDIDTTEYQYLDKMSDNRDVSELLEDLIGGWIAEDLIASETNATHNGSDAERKIAESLSDITTDPDLIIDGDKVEVVTDYHSNWVNSGSIEFRSNKWKKMNDNTYIFGFDVSNGQYFQLKKSKLKENNVKYIAEYKPYGGRPVFSIDISSISFSEF